MSLPPSSSSPELGLLLKQHSAWKVRNAANALHLSEQEEMIEGLVRLLTQRESEIQILKNKPTAIKGTGARTEERCQSYEALKLELEQEKDTRARWQARTKDVESQIHKEDTLQILVLVDGNHHFFRDALVRAGAHGARDAVHIFLKEVQDFARSQHKNDFAPLPDSIKVVVHVFSDIGRLADDLSAASLLPDPDTLWTFVQEICKIAPTVTISDCGNDPRAVDNKVQEFYSLFIENCHVRHILLALAPKSDYYTTLQMYNDDDYTRKKTSLVKPEGGFPAGVNLDFPVVEFSTLKAVASAKSRAAPKMLTPGGSHSDINSWSASESRRKPNDTGDLLGSIGEQVIADTTKLTPDPLTSKKSEESSWESDHHSQVPAPILGAWGTDTITHVEQREKQDAWQTGNKAGHGRHVGWGKGENLHVSTTQTNGNNEAKASNMQTRPEQRGIRQFKGGWDDMPKNYAGNAEQSLHSDSAAEHPTSTSTTRSSISSLLPDASTSVTSPAVSRANMSPSSTTAPAQGSKLGLGRPGSSSSSNDSSFPNGSWRVVNGLSRKAFESNQVTQRQPDPERRPIWSPIALNQYEQRIDLKLPSASDADKKLFWKRHSSHKLCNKHHLRGTCGDADKCAFDHDSISMGLYLQLRLIARQIPCANGPGCRDQACHAGHHCANVGALKECGQPNCAFGRAGMHETRDFVVVKMLNPSEQED